MRTINEAKILLLHSKGLSNRKIAEKESIHHTTVGAVLKRNKLLPNTTPHKHADICGKKIKCSKCGEKKDSSNYLLNRKNQKYPYRLSYCNSCRRNQITAGLNAKPIKILRDIFRRAVNRSGGERPSFTFEHILSIYRLQKGLCFYTGIKMVLKRGTGFQPYALTIDKVVPEKGYIDGNVVLCTKRFNTVKSDLSISELKKWIPSWYKKLSKCKWLKITYET